MNNYIIKMPDTLNMSRNPNIPNDMYTFGHEVAPNLYHNRPIDKPKNLEGSVLAGTEGISRTLKKGDKGNDVKQLQSLLKSRGYNITIDGIFGNETKTQLAKFQKDYNKNMVYKGESNIAVDGILGRQTMGALFDKYVYRKPDTFKPTVNPPQVTPNPDIMGNEPDGPWWLGPAYAGLGLGVAALPYVTTAASSSALSTGTMLAREMAKNAGKSASKLIPKTLPPRSLPNSTVNPGKYFPRTAPQNPGQPYGRFHFAEGGLDMPFIY